jgi:rhomboid protease GluP
MQKLYRDLTREQADTFELVLLASNIQCEIAMGIAGWELWVADGAAQYAIQILGDYVNENAEADDARDSPPIKIRKTWAGIWGSAALLVWYVAVHMAKDVTAIHQAYAASASDILSGEWYRCTTALFLHAGVGHLSANLAAMAVFATAVCSVTGWGMGWLLILFSGILGNLLNAQLYTYGHRAIGASTAVFGALGLLCAYQMIQRKQTPGRRFSIWLPLGAGLALLAFVGASPHTDIMAHLFGFLAGLGLGGMYYRLYAEPLKWPYEMGALAVVVLVVGRAWWGP